MSIGIYLGAIGLNWLILFKEYKMIKKRLSDEGYVFNTNKKISNECIISFIQLMSNTIIPGVNLLNILSIIFMKNEIYNLIKTILILDEIIDYDDKTMYYNTDNTENELNKNEKINENIRIDKIKQLKTEKEKLLDNSNIDQKQYVLKK